MADIRLSQLIAPPFHDVHRDVLLGGNSEYLLKGGRGSGKSSYISLEIVSGLLRDDQANAIVYRKVGETLRGSVYEQIAWAVEMLGLQRWFRFRLSPLEIEIPSSGQRIAFNGSDDPKKSKGIKLRRGYWRFLWFEEASDFRGMDELRTIKASIVRGSGEKAATFMSYNPPQSMNNWINAEALVPTDGRLVHHSTYEQVPHEWLGADFIRDAEALRARDEMRWRWMYGGEATGTGGAVFGNLRLECIPESEHNRFDRLLYGLDFGYAVDPDALVKLHYERRTRTLYVLDEYCKAQVPLARLIEAAGQMCGRAPITCDSADPLIIAELRRAGLGAIGAKKGPMSVEHGIRWLRELDAIVIDPVRCPNSAREFSGYEFRQDKYGNFMEAYPDANNHTIDAARYAVESISTARVAKVISRSGLGI